MIAALAAAGDCVGHDVFRVSVGQAAVLGLTQGLSEFLPISSSGHLVVVPWAFGWRDVTCPEAGNKAFDVALHLGTFAGAATYLRRDLITLIRAWFASIAARSIRTPEQRMAWLLVLSTVPAAVIGVVFQTVLTERFSEPWLIAVWLAVFGLLLWLVDARRPQRTAYADIGTREGVAMGFAQAVALMPGVSRSGATMTAARAMGVRRDAAARFSFLMSLPITFGAALAALRGADFSGYRGAVTVGVLASAVSGGFAVFALLAYLRRHSYGVFALYRLAVAGGVLTLIVTSAREATIG